MRMKFLVNFGYGAHAVYDIDFLDVIASGIPVKEYGYGKDATYLPNDSALEITLIRADQFKVKEQDQSDVLLKKITELEKEASEQRSMRWAKERELKELQKLIPTKEVTE